MVFVILIQHLLNEVILKLKKKKKNPGSQVLSDVTTATRLGFLPGEKIETFYRQIEGNLHGMVWFLPTISVITRRAEFNQLYRCHLLTFLKKKKWKNSVHLLR